MGEDEEQPSVRVAIEGDAAVITMLGEEGTTRWGTPGELAL